MDSIANPPLIEAIAEIRWGKVQSNNNIEFSEKEAQFFMGQFKAIAAQNGFSYFERINKPLPDFFPHSVTFRFRKKENSWPCFQIGLGIFTINQFVDGYNWESFKKAILSGIDLLDKGHPDSLTGLNAIGVELRYRDGYVYENKHDALAFLKKAFNIELGMLKGDFINSSLIEDELTGAGLVLSFRTKTPPGILIFDLKQGVINGQKGFIGDTIIRSMDKDAPKLNIPNLTDWFENSHNLQKHAFKTLLNPAYIKGLE